MSTKRLYPNSASHMPCDANAATLEVLKAKALSFILNPDFTSWSNVFKNVKYSTADKEFRSLTEFICFHSDPDIWRLTSLLLPVFVHIVIHIFMQEGPTSSNLFVRRNKGVFITKSEYDDILMYLGNLKDSFQIFCNQAVECLWKSRIHFNTSVKAFTELQSFLKMINSEVLLFILYYLVEFHFPVEEDFVPHTEIEQNTMPADDNARTFTKSRPLFVSGDINFENTEVALVTENSSLVIVNFHTSNAKCKPDKLPPVYCVRYLSENILLIGTDKKVITVNTYNLEIIQESSHPHTGVVQDVDAFQYVNHFVVATAGEDTIASTFCFGKKVISLLLGHKSSVNCVRFHPDGRYIATGSSDFDVRFWTVDGRCLMTFSQHDSAVDFVTFSPGGQLLTSADAKGKILTRNLLDDLKFSETSFGYHPNLTVGKVNSMCYTRSCSMLAASCKAGIVKVWSLGKPFTLKIYTESIMQVPSISFINTDYVPNGLVVTHVTNNRQKIKWKQCILTKKDSPLIKISQSIGVTKKKLKNLQLGKNKRYIFFKNSRNVFKNSTKKKEKNVKEKYRHFQTYERSKSRQENKNKVENSFSEELTNFIPQQQIPVFCCELPNNLSPEAILRKSLIEGATSLLLKYPEISLREATIQALLDIKTTVPKAVVQKVLNELITDTSTETEEEKLIQGSIPFFNSEMPLSKSFPEMENFDSIEKVNAKVPENILDQTPSAIDKILGSIPIFNNEMPLNKSFPKIENSNSIEKVTHAKVPENSLDETSSDFPENSLDQTSSDFQRLNISSLLLEGITDSDIPILPGSENLINNDLNEQAEHKFSLLDDLIPEIDIFDTNTFL